MTRLTRLAAISLACSALAFAQAPAQDGVQQFAWLGDCRLESGQVIGDCRVGYRIFGKLNDQKSNAILFPTWFTGNTQDLANQIGPGKLVDSSAFYVVAVDAFGNGVSSSPSNSDAQPRSRFPQITIRDMVNSQRRLLTEVLKIQHLRAVMGISMGGMQTFQWIVSYPDFMDRAVPIVGSPQLSSYDLLLWCAEEHAIQSDRAWNNGEYSSPPEAGLRAAADIHALALQTPELRVKQTPPKDFPKFLDSTEQGFLKRNDANNLLRQLEAMINHDVTKSYDGSLERAAAAVKARVLVVVALHDHMVNPQPALAFARLLKAPTVELASDCGHVATGCEAAKVTAAVDKFLK